MKPPGNRRSRAALVALLVVGLLAGGLAWLSGRAGQDFVRRRVAAAAGDAIAGRLDVGGAQLSGGHLVLTDVKLFTPEGELVAEVARVELDVDLAAATRGEVRLSSVRLSRPRLSLVQDARGLNLARALAARGPSSGPSRPLRLALEALVLDEGAVSFTDGARAVRLEGLAARGAATVMTGPLTVASSLTLTGRATAPVDGPLSLAAATTSPAPGQVQVHAELRVADEALTGTLDWPSLEGNVEALTVTPALVTALAGAPLLPRPVTARGRLSPRAVDLTLTGGAATATVRGAFDLERRTVEALAVQADGVDLSEWLVGGTPSRLSLTATGRATDTSAAGLTGALAASLRWRTPAGASLADVTLDVEAAHGALTARQARAEVPGAALSLTGRAAPDALALSGALAASDLSALARAVEALTGAAPPPLAGAGTLSVALSGPPKRPRLTARGALFRLRVASAAAERLDLDVTLPDVSAPFDAAGRLTARGLDVSGRRLDEVRADVKTHGRELALTLETKGLGDLRLSLDGTLDADASGLALTGLRLDDARAAWALAGPARLRWSPSLELSPLTLASKGQRFEARATLRGQRLDAAVTATDVNLATLPRVLAPEALGLSGVVSGRVSATGRLPRPDVTASLRARDAAVLGVRHVDGRLDGALEGGVARGTASVSTSLGAVDGAFEVPLAGLLDDAPEPLSVRASFTGVSLEALQAWRAQTWPVSGTLSGRLELGGRANDPALTLLVESPRVTVTPTGPLTGPLHLDATALGVSSRDAGALAVTLGARVEGAEARLTLDTPLSLRALRAKSPTVERLRALPVTLSLALTDLPLSALRRLGVPGADDVAGVASLRVAATGSLDDPRGQATLSWRGVTAPPLEGLDGALELTTTDTVTRLAGTGRLEGRPLFELDAFVDAPPGRLVAPAALGAEQVTARLSLAPMPLGRFFPHRDDDVVPSGSVSVDLGVTGRLDDPQVSVDATVQALSFGKVPLGQARLVSRTKGRSQALALTLKARGNSELRATGVVGFDPSIELLRQGLDIGAVPLRLDVTATAFDLGFLSGVTPTVRTVGGRLGLDAFEVRGTLGAPDLNGTVTWKQGRLALASSGDFRDIDVEVGVTNERIDVRTLSVRSGSGSLVLDPSSAQRRPGAGWQLRGSGAASRFSLVNDDQLLAIVSAKVKLEGEVTPGLVDLSTVELARVDVELPEVKRKDVQDLERPRDVVLVRGGRVVAGRRRADGPVAAAAPSRAWRAVLVAPRNLWVRSSDLNVELGLSDAFRVEYADSTQLFGEARVLGGRIDVIGREFKVNRVDPSGQRSESTARFTGPASTPLINVRAEHTNEREKVKVVVAVTGRGKDVSLQVSSDPPMSESDIYTLLATGRRDLRRSSGASITAEQAVSVVGSLAANELKNALLKKLPIDIIDVVSIDTGSEGLASTRVEVGKYLSDSLYLGYTFQPGANKARGENTHAGRLELQLSKNVCVEATAGDAPAAGVDMVWSRDW